MLKNVFENWPGCILILGLKNVEHSIVDTCIAIDPIGVNIKVNYEIVPNEDVHRAHCVC